MDRETINLPNSQFYTAAVSSLTSMLSPIAQTPPAEKEKTELLNTPQVTPPVNTPSTPVFELTEEVKSVKWNH